MLKEYGTNHTCAFCRGTKLSLIMNFGHMGLAGGFLSEKDLESEIRYPMNLYYCVECFAVQIVDKIDSDTMFKGYFYFSSSIKTLRDHFTCYAKEVVDRFIPSPESATVIEIGCNDGVLLSPLADFNVGNLVGVDPATNVVESINDSRINVVNSYFDQACADEVVNRFGHANLILANNVFAHVNDINALTSAIVSALDRDGVFIFEVHYLGKIIDEMQYDMIYHEHIYYYSLLSIENHFHRYGMNVFDVVEVDNHGGSMRFHVCRKGTKYSSQCGRVKILRQLEYEKGFNNVSFFSEFGKQIVQQKEDFLSLLCDLRENGFTVVGYGASGRANTMLQFCNIDNSLIDYIVDDAPAKTGFYTPGSHLKIEAKISLLEKHKPDYIVIFAWTFLKEIYQRNLDYLESGGQFIVPLPQVKIFDIDSLNKLYSTNGEKLK